METQGSGTKIMAKLMAGFIKNCKIILLMLMYEIMLTYLMVKESWGLERKGQPNYST